MKLRPRFGLTVLAVGIPLIVALTWTRFSIEHSAAVDSLTRLVLQRMSNGGRAECDSWPETWPSQPSPELGMRMGMGMGMGSMPSMAERRKRMRAMLGVEEAESQSFAYLGEPVEFFAYLADFSSLNSEAPELTEELLAGLHAGLDVVSSGQASDSDTTLEVAVRMTWFGEPDSPCAVVLARQVGGGKGLAREFLLGAVIVTSVILLALFWSAGPVVGRIARLTRRVREAAGDHYATPVPVEGNDEISELAHAFNTAGTELREHTELLNRRERRLREFVEGTTHDVMLPLTVLQGHLSCLGQRASTEEAATLRDALEEAHYMTSLIRNLGTAAKLEADDSTPRTDPIDLVALCERVVARHLPIAREKGVTIEPVLPGEPVILHGDSTLLEQAVSNLVHNAVRYVDTNGRILIVLSQKAGHFSLRVLDDGPGIAEEHLKHLTKRRWRADAARTRHPEGCGLGLAIAHEVVLRHGLQLHLRIAPELGGLEAEIRN